MAFDGIVVANLAHELNHTILNSRISKIAQPEKDELLFTLKGPNGQWRLAMSASASLPFLYLTKQNKQSPLTGRVDGKAQQHHFSKRRRNHN